MRRHALAWATLAAALCSSPGCQRASANPSALPATTDAGDANYRLVSEADTTRAYHTGILRATDANTFFRKVLETSKFVQLVVMSVPPGESIGYETHSVDQVLVFLSGSGEFKIGKDQGPIKAGDLFIVPARTPHDFINTGKVPLKLYTLYAPPQHPPGTVHKTKAEAQKAEGAGH